MRSRAPADGARRARAFAVLLAAAVPAQDDGVRLATGEAIDGIAVQSFDVRALKYAKGQETVSVPAERVLRVELARAAEVLRRGLALRDPELLRATAREQFAAHSALLAQAGMLEAARLAVAAGKDRDAAAVFDELRRQMPDAGVLPAILRLRCERGLEAADADGLQAAAAAAQRWQSEAATWPAGLQIEGEWYAARIAREQGADADGLLPRLRELSARAHGSSQLLADRVQMSIADELLRSGDATGARAIWQPIVDAPVADATARAGAWLGLGRIALQAGTVEDRAPWRQAMLLFLRVGIDTPDAAPHVQAAALLLAAQAAGKWGGEDSRVVAARCRAALLADHPASAAARRVQKQ